MDIRVLQPIVDAVRKESVEYYVEDTSSIPRLPTHELYFDYTRKKDGSVPETDEDLFRVADLVFQALRQGLVELGARPLKEVTREEVPEGAFFMSVLFRNQEGRMDILKLTTNIGDRYIEGCTEDEQAKVSFYVCAEGNSIPLSQIFANAGPQMKALGEKLDLAEIEQAHSHRGGPGIS